MCEICLADELQPVNPLPPVYRNFGGHLLDEWCNIPQDQIDNLILSMPSVLRGSVLLCKPKIEDSIPAGIDRYSGCENLRQACHMIMLPVKDLLSISLALGMFSIRRELELNKFSSFDDGDIEEDPSRMIERVEYLGSYPSDIENSILSSNIDLSKTHILGVDLSTFLPPLEEPLGVPGEASCQNPFNCTYRLTNVQGRPTMLALPMAVTHPYNYENDRMYDSNPDLMDQNSLPALQGEPLQHSQSMVLPEVSQKCDLDAVHQSRTKSFGIELDDFLPRNMDPAKNSYGSLEISDAEAISSIYRGHESMNKVLTHRKKYLQSVMRIWKTEGPIAGLTSAIHMSDSAILVDILTLLITKPSSWTLDMCQLLLPVICDLLKSKYETYITIGCMSLKLIMKNFAQVIKINITAPKGVGIDISREERLRPTTGIHLAHCPDEFHGHRSDYVRQEAKTRYRVSLVSAHVTTLEEDLKQQPLCQDSPKDVLSDSGLEI
ncbi:katanin p80 WD40 repeat-containing subunit B1 [Trichonephila clavipes]|nr:katanin p80 WD40 repeat-containing subunit B1 [Trichonephila clavipes]